MRGAERQEPASGSDAMEVLDDEELSPGEPRWFDGELWVHDAIVVEEAVSALRSERPVANPL